MFFDEDIIQNFQQFLFDARTVYTGWTSGGASGSKVIVQINGLHGGRNIQSAIAFSPLRAGDCVLVKASDGIWYAVQEQENVSKGSVRLIESSPRPVEHFPFKVLFYTIQGGTTNFYVGGDRSQPAKLYTKQSNFYYYSGDPSLTDFSFNNTGKLPENYVIGLKFLSYPYNTSGSADVVDLYGDTAKNWSLPATTQNYFLKATPQGFWQSPGRTPVFQQSPLTDHFSSSNIYYDTFNPDYIGDLDTRPDPVPPIPMYLGFFVFYLGSLAPATYTINDPESEGTQWSYPYKIKPILGETIGKYHSVSGLTGDPGSADGGAYEGGPHYGKHWTDHDPPEVVIGFYGPPEGSLYPWRRTLSTDIPYHKHGTITRNCTWGILDPGISGQGNTLIDLNSPNSYGIVCVANFSDVEYFEEGKKGTQIIIEDTLPYLDENAGATYITRTLPTPKHYWLRQENKQFTNTCPPVSLYTENKILQSKEGSYSRTYNLASITEHRETESIASILYAGATYTVGTFFPSYWADWNNYLTYIITWYDQVNINEEDITNEVIPVAIAPGIFVNSSHYEYHAKSAFNRTDVNKAGNYNTNAGNSIVSENNNSVDTVVITTTEPQTISDAGNLAIYKQTVTHSNTTKTHVGNGFAYRSSTTIYDNGATTTTKIETFPNQINYYLYDKKSNTHTKINSTAFCQGNYINTNIELNISVGTITITASQGNLPYFAHEPYNRVRTSTITEQILDQNILFYIRTDENRFESIHIGDTVTEDTTVLLFDHAVNTILDQVQGIYHTGPYDWLVTRKTITRLYTYDIMPFWFHLQGMNVIISQYVDGLHPEKGTIRGFGKIIAFTYEEIPYNPQSYINAPKEFDRTLQSLTIDIFNVETIPGDSLPSQTAIICPNNNSLVQLSDQPYTSQHLNSLGNYLTSPMTNFVENPDSTNPIKGTLYKYEYPRQITGDTMGYATAFDLTAVAGNPELQVIRRPQLVEGRINSISVGEDNQYGTIKIICGVSYFPEDLG